MAKFVWAIDGKKYNIANVSLFFIDYDGSVYRAMGKIKDSPFLPPICFAILSTADDAKKFIDEITASEVDKFAGPLVATFIQYVQSLMPEVKGNA